MEIVLGEQSNTHLSIGGESIVREIDVEDGVRVRDLVAALTDEERHAIKSAARVTTCLFLQGAIAELGERVKRRVRVFRTVQLPSPWGEVIGRGRSSKTSEGGKAGQEDEEARLVRCIERLSF